MRRATALQLGRQGVAPVYEVDEEPNLICREVGLAHHLLGGCGDIAEEPSGIEQHPSRVLVLTEPLGAMNDDADVIQSGVTKMKPPGTPGILSA
jgi:hypothetical protein